MAWKLCKHFLFLAAMAIGVAAVAVGWLWMLGAAVYSGRSGHGEHGGQAHPLLPWLLTTLLIAASLFAWRASSKPLKWRAAAVLLAAFAVMGTHVARRPRGDHLEAPFANAARAADAADAAKATPRWAPEHAFAPRISIESLSMESSAADRYVISHVRQRRVTKDGAQRIEFRPRTLRADQIQAVWLGVQHFTVVTPIAHTFLSFELDDDTFLAVSVEARRVESQSYSPLAGLYRSYELVYVFGSEREVTGRALGEMNRTTESKGEEGAEPFPLYLYRTIATPEQAQAMFHAVVNRANQVESSPEFYHTLLNNCTTNIVHRCNEVAPIRISPLNPRIMLPGYTGAAAYRHGLLDQTKSFESLRQAARVTGDE